ncbi:MAG TPA: hypothetical protein VEF89_02540 [Solirubrobacteraceae bacterium]|nr:hypothetical protein [Solirubrobacteraceae bacterium]
MAELAKGEGLEDAGALVACYERLRKAVLSGDAGGWRLGHGVLCARGMVGWMSAVGSLAPPAGGGKLVAPSQPEGAGPSSGRPVSLPAADQVVAVLTQMVLPLAA